MSSPSDHSRDLTAIRSDLAGLAVAVGFLRAERALRHKYDPAQSREPAGQPGGGRWSASDVSVTGSSATDESSATREVVTEDGSRVLSLRIRSRSSRGWDEEHTVIAPDGTQTVFEMEGRTQTIRDGQTSEILSRSTLVDGRAEPEAFVQQAGVSSLAQAGSRTLYNAAAALLAALSVRTGRNGAIFEAPASLYEPRKGTKTTAVWVGPVDEQEMRAACPQRGLVQTILDEATAEVRAIGNFNGPQDFGNKVHAVAAIKIRALRNPNLVAETSYVYGNENPVRYGTRFSIRLDVLERSVPQTVCVHDHKTGESGISAVRATSITEMIAKNFPDTQQIILSEIRPTDDER